MHVGLFALGHFVSWAVFMSDIAAIITAITALIAVVGGYVQFVVRRTLLPCLEFDVEFLTLSCSPSDQSVGEILCKIRNRGPAVGYVTNVRCRVRYRITGESGEMRGEPRFPHELPPGGFLVLDPEKRFIQPGVTQQSWLPGWQRSCRERASRHSVLRDASRRSLSDRSGRSACPGPDSRVALRLPRCSCSVGGVENRSRAAEVVGREPAAPAALSITATTVQVPSKLARLGRDVVAVVAGSGVFWHGPGGGASVTIAGNRRSGGGAGWRWRTGGGSPRR
jgi:hypothetical protein